MARHYGGIFSRARGTTSGIVFSEIRTKEGKSQISRQLVSPTDPKSPGQIQQREKWRTAVDAMSVWGSGLWRELFDRSVGQLPGFQSLETRVEKMLNDDGSLNAPRNIRNGNAFGWDFGTVDYNATDASKIIVTIGRNEGSYPSGTTLHTFLFINNSQDWREGESNFYIYQKSTLGAADNEIVNEFDFEGEEDTELVAGNFVEYPANSPRLRSSSTFTRDVILEIQDMKNHG